MRDVEVQQVAELETTQTKITEQLSAMHWEKSPPPLSLRPDKVFYKQIDAITVIDHQLPSPDGNQGLFLYS